MKILLVDDEPLILSSLRTMISKWPEPEVTILTADNADDAQSILRAQAPEILLTDIQMPCQTGLTLLEYIVRENLYTITICVTGYSDFNYVQTALRNNAFDYLLKPVQQDELFACLNKAKQRYSQRDNNRKLTAVPTSFYENKKEILKKQFLEELLLNPTGTEKLELKKQALVLGLDFSHYRLISIQCNLENESFFPNQSFYSAYTLDETIHHEYPSISNCFIGNIEYIIWTIKENQTPVEDYSALLNFFDCIRLKCHESLLPEIIMAISTESKDIEDLPMLNYQLQICLSSGDFSYQSDSQDKAILYEDICEYENNAEIIGIDIARFIGRLYSYTPSGTNFKEISTLWNHASNMSADAQGNIIKLLQASINEMIRSSHLSDTLKTHFVNNMSEWAHNQCDFPAKKAKLSSLISQISKEMSVAHEEHKSQITEKVCEFIRDNYSKQIGLSDVADYVQRNPSYISRLLNNELNKGFNQLLTEQRISVAKKLLETTTLRITEIAEKTGYSNPRYFNQVFSSNVKMAPGEYREIMTILK